MRQADVALLAEESRSQEEFVDRASRLCMEAAGADRAVFMDLAGGPIGVRPVGFDEESLRTFYECQLLVPGLEAEMERVFRTMSKAQFYVEDELYSVSERDRLRIFTEISRPQRSLSNVAIMLSWRGRPAAAIRLERVGTSGPRFTRKALAPVVAQLSTLSLGWAAVSGQGTLPLARASMPPLSTRERELCRYVARGLHNGEIAQLLGTSPNTVRNQLSTLFKKVEVTTRTELAIWYETVCASLDPDAGEPFGARVISTLADGASRFLRRP